MMLATQGHGFDSQGMHELMKSLNAVQTLIIKIWCDVMKSLIIFGTFGGHLCVCVLVLQQVSDTWNEC